MMTTKEIEKSITLYTYIGEIINNEDGRYDKIEMAWFVVPTEWITEQIKPETMESFLDSYTYDESADLYQRANEEGVLLGGGFGKNPEQEKTYDEHCKKGML